MFPLSTLPLLLTLSLSHFPLTNATTTTTPTLQGPTSNVDFSQAFCDAARPKTAADCWATPTLPHWGVSLLEPADEKCFNISQLFEFSYRVVPLNDDSHPERQPKTSALQLYQLANVAKRNRDRDQIAKVVPVCRGKGEVRNLTTIIATVADVYRAHKYDTCSLALVELPPSNGANRTEGRIYSQIGNTKRKGGFWVSDDCTKLKREVCEGRKGLNPPPDNRFYLKALDSCPDLGVEAKETGKGLVDRDEESEMLLKKRIEKGGQKSFVTFGGAQI